MKIKYDLISPTAPEMPKHLPEFVRLAISKVPDYMQPAAANAMFAPAAAHLYNIVFRYRDNTLHEATCMEGCVAASGVGKGYLGPMLEALIRKLRWHDAESQRKLVEYSRQYHRAGKNGEKPDRPSDAAILVPEPNMTNPAFILLLMDAELEGNRSLYTPIPEIDLLNGTCGGHSKVTNVLRVNFDTKRYGAQRATPEGITGNPFMRWKFNFSCVVEKAQQFFKNNIADGTAGRICFSYIPKPQRKGIPYQGDYDEPYYRMLDLYLDRLSNAKGVLQVPELDAVMARLEKYFDEVCDLSDNDTFGGWVNRAQTMGWIKGCILYISQGMKWDPKIGRFVEWSIFYDLWSKISIFAPNMKSGVSVSDSDKRKYGPANMLDMLPTSFSQEQLEQLRQKLDKDANGCKQLGVWIDREYITYDASTHLYTKTEKYLKKHPQE